MTDEANPDDLGGEPGMPRWAKIGVVIAVVLVLVLIIGKAVGIEHGPNQHASSGKADTKEGDAPETGHKPPEGGHG